MGRKCLADSEFKRRVKKIHGGQFAILSDYHGLRSKVKVRCNLCNWIGEARANHLFNPSYGTRCPLHDCKQYDSSSFQKAINKIQDSQYTLLSKFVNTRTKVKVRCKKCGKEFHVCPKSLLQRRIGKNCNHRNCNHLVRLDFEQAAKRLDKISDGEIKLIRFSGMNYVATFKHLECGNIWQAKASHVFNDSEDCPYCSSSKGEKAVTEYLKKKGYHFEPQFKIGACRDKLPLPFDFAVFNKDKSLNSLIEYEGCQHFMSLFKFKKGDFYSKESVISVQKHDKMKSAFCKEHGIQLIQINHPQDTSKSNKPSFIAGLVKRVLDRELKVN